MTYLTPIRKRKLSQMFAVAIGWLIISIMLGLFDAVNFDYKTDSFVINYIGQRSMFDLIKYNLITGTIGGLIGGYFIVFITMGKFRGLSYGHMLSVTSILYILCIFVSATAIGFIYSSLYLDKPLHHPDVVVRVGHFITSPGIIKVIATWYIVIVLTVFTLQVNDKYGQGVLAKLIMGQYHQPRTEQRIFMFLDLKSSTTIAESIGHKQYFMLLQELYALITTPIINHFGEIYQYVGDEVVLSWDLHKGLRKAHVMHCFYAIVAVIEKNRQKFEERYGLLPSFKAGIHMGPVTSGEVGIIKKDIVFSGDVLNTTSRIMHACNFYQCDLIISADLYHALPAGQEFEFTTLGISKLKGKEQEVELFSVNKLDTVR